MASLYPHPWDPLSGEEITRAIDVVRKTHGEKLHYQAVTLLEPRKSDMTSWLEKKGPRPQRLADVTAIGASGKVYDAFVDLAGGIIIKWEELKDCQPIVSLEFTIHLFQAVHH
jgi:primary-amine oxidase